MRISILGPLEVRGSASAPTAKITGGRLRTLVILLALEPGRVITADRLIDGIWGEEPPAGAPNALQSLVSRLRRLLPPDVIESHPAGYRLAVPAEAVDAHRFEQLAAEGRALLDEDDEHAARKLRAALELWRGPALADAAGAGFAHRHIARLEEFRLAVTEDRIRAELALGRHVTLIPELEELVSTHPLRERLTAQLMRALQSSGRQAGALAAYERIRSALAEELGADPSPELQRGHLAVLRGESATPRTRTPGTTQPRTNLPSSITSFVGREEDVRGVSKQLAAHRLVTLTGPGGAGKTRLATECARGMLDTAADGVWFVQLAPVTEPAEVPRAVLGTLGVRESSVLTPMSGPVHGSGPADPAGLDRLASALRGKELLLVLDNCEHVIDVAAELADRLLGTCPRVRILTTSRERLGITGEVLWPVPSLAMPAPGATVQDAMTCAAVRLLADRAVAVRPDFSVTAANLDDVAAICRALDGMPLAIELAAARLRSLSERQVAERLSDRFRLLTGGSRTVLPRHQTLRAVVEWSWDLLGEEERALARRLSVFSGGATLEAVEHVCGDEAFPDDNPAGDYPAGDDPAGDRRAVMDVESVLSALIDKSLVVTYEVCEQAPRTLRYRMLETIRAYGLERLAEAEEKEAAGRAHAAYFLDRAETGEPLLRTREQLEWFGWFAVEHDNLRAALRWVIDTDDTESAVRFGAALGWWLWLRGLRVEGEGWMAEISAMNGPAPAESWAAVLIHRAFYKLGITWDFEKAGEEIMNAQRLLEGDRGHHPIVVLSDAFCAFVTSAHEEALKRLEAKRDDPDPWIRAATRLYGGAGLFNIGRIDAAEQQLEDALGRFRELGEDWGIIQTLSSLAEVAALRGEDVVARDAVDEALERAGRLGAREDMTNLLMRRGWQHARLGDLDAADADLTAAEELSERLGLTEWTVFVANFRGEIARLEGDLDEAARWFQRALDGVPATGVAPPQHVAVVNCGMAHLELARGDLVSAARRSHTAARAALDCLDYPVMGLVADVLAARALAEGAPAKAAELLGAAAVLRGVPEVSSPDMRRIMAAAKESLGDRAFADVHDRATAMPREAAIALLEQHGTAAGDR